MLEIIGNIALLICSHIILVPFPSILFPSLYPQTYWSSHILTFRSPLPHIFSISLFSFLKNNPPSTLFQTFHIFHTQTIHSPSSPSSQNHILPSLHNILLPTDSILYNLMFPFPAHILLTSFPAFSSISYQMSHF